MVINKLQYNAWYTQRQISFRAFYNTKILIRQISKPTHQTNINNLRNANLINISILHTKLHGPEFVQENSGPNGQKFPCLLQKPKFHFSDKKNLLIFRFADYNFLHISYTSYAYSIPRSSHFLRVIVLGKCGLRFQISGVFLQIIWHHLHLALKYYNAYNFMYTHPIIGNDELSKITWN